ncbi:uncharacterized protein C8orf48-like, partial [Notamacropus eugenii]|uniref:uncharacterized protein C8orf48-like n=1 Tax=Notamacropus eugenii TaxID=9315 RepID=UPI003B66D79B
RPHGHRERKPRPLPCRGPCVGRGWGLWALPVARKTEVRTRPLCRCPRGRKKRRPRYRSSKPRWAAPRGPGSLWLPNTTWEGSAVPYAVLGGASPKMPRVDSPQSEVEYSRAPSDYSSETFESFTEEEEEEVEEGKCHLTEGKSSDSLVSSEEGLTRSSVSGSYPVSKKLMPSFKDGDESLNPLESATLDEKLTQKWIQLLKGKESHTEEPQAGPTFQADIVEASKSEQDALQAFCARKVKLIRHQLNPQETNGGSRQRQQRGLDAGKPVTDEANNCVVPPRLINRISQQNLRAAPSKASAVGEHTCSRCPECTKKRGELSQLAFLRQKKTFLESTLLQEKMEEHHHTKSFSHWVMLFSENRKKHEEKGSVIARDTH